MKKIFMLALLLMVGTYSFAQISAGIKAGINANKLISSDEDLESDGTKIGLVVGGFLRVGVAGFYVQPELVFAQKGGKLKTKESFFSQGTVTRDLNTIDVPIMLGKSFAGGLFRFNFGPVVSFPISVKQELQADLFNAFQVSEEKEATADYKEAMNAAYVGYQVGIGSDISKLTFDLRYEGSLSKLGNELPGGFKTDDRVSTFQFTVGFKFL